jgi:hypothetical protein
LFGKQAAGRTSQALQENTSSVCGNALPVRGISTYHPMRSGEKYEKRKRRTKI